VTSVEQIVQRLDELEKRFATAERERDEYLRDIFCLLPRWPEHRLLDLAPVAWNETRARADVQALLDANPFRKLTLDTRG
jgi:hypothetical protein